MTQYGLSLGQLIQGGLSRGADIYQSGQAMAMQREQMARQAEMDAMRRQAMQQELAQRALAASEYADQRDADREFMDLYARTYLADPEAQAPAPRTGMGPADDGAIWLTPPTPATQAMPDWRQLSRASPRVQNLFLEAGENARLTRERAKKERDEFNALIGTGLSRFTGPKEDTPEAWGEVANKYRRAMERGDVTSADVRKHAPRKVVEILDADEESHRARMVDYLTIGRGQNGETVQDEAEAVLLSGYPTRQLEAMVGSRRAEERKSAAEAQNAEAEIQRETAAMLAVTPSLTPDKARAFVMARRAGLVNQEAVNISGRVPQADITAQREAAKYEAGAAKDAMERAEKAYRDVTGTTSESGGFRAGPLVPPTQAERDRLKHPATTKFGDGVADMSDDDYGALKAKVSAWDAYEKAAADFAAASNAAVRAMTPSQSRPVPPQLAPAQVPTASPATPAMADPAGQVNRKPPADLFREAVSELQDERGGFDVVSLVRRMRDAGVDPETVKALMAEHGVGVVGGTP